MKRSHKGTRPPQRLIPCMPPLLEEEKSPLSREDGTTKFGGTACEHIVMTYFLRKNINVATLEVDDGVDLLIEKPDEGWKRGQVKKVVYQTKLDYGYKQQHGVDLYRPRYNFNFQSGGKTAPHLKNGRRQRGPGDYDYFYHVLMTPYREMIWELPVDKIPLREDGSFISNKSPSLDSSNWIRKRAEINFNDHLISVWYDPIVFKTFPDFFLKEQTSLEKFFDDPN